MPKQKRQQAKRRNPYAHALEYVKPSRIESKRKAKNKNKKYYSKKRFFGEDE